MEIDDEIVSEYDVILNDPSPLYLLQYPLRPRYRPYGDQGDLISASLSETSLDLHYTLNTNNSNYDRSNSEFKQDTQTLAGKPIIPLTKYCIGYTSNKTLTLTPLCKIMQMRPSSAHLDAVLDRRQIEDQVELAQMQHEKETKKLRVFKKKEVKETIKEAESVNLKCFDMKSPEAAGCFKQLISSCEVEVKEIKEDYVKSILPSPLKPTGFRENLRDMPAAIAIEELLRQAEVVNTEEVLEIIIGEKNIESLLIQKASVIDGRWVRKSEVFKESSARDVCLYYLWKQGEVVRAEVNEIVGRDCKEILQGFAVLEARVWKVKGCPSDIPQSFVVKSKEYWDAKASKLVKEFDKFKT